MYALRGEVFDVAVDVRVGSPTFGRTVTTMLSGDNHRQIFVPVGFAHGFVVPSDDALVAYKCSDYYSPEASSIRWNDPALAIPWPMPHPDSLAERRRRAAAAVRSPRDQLPRSRRLSAMSRHRRFSSSVERARSATSSCASLRRSERSSRRRARSSISDVADVDSRIVLARAAGDRRQRRRRTRRSIARSPSRELCAIINADAPALLADECKTLGAMFVHFSTDYVFDGTKRTPYVETDEPRR